MGIAKKSDGRYVVGMGIDNANEYNGSMAYRDIVIQLTEDGATADSVKKLEYLRDYAEYHASIGEPIVPPNVSIWISGNRFSKAVEADDINMTESGFEIGGITYNGEAWDYSNAGQGSGGSGGVFWVRMTTAGQEIDPDYGPYYVYSADKTAEEIKQAHDNGDEVLLIAHNIDAYNGDAQIGFDEAIVPLRDVDTSSGIICSFAVNAFKLNDETNTLNYTDFWIVIGKESGTSGENYIQVEGYPCAITVTPVEP